MMASSSSSRKRALALARGAGRDAALAILFHSTRRDANELLLLAGSPAAAATPPIKLPREFSSSFSAVSSSSTSSSTSSAPPLPPPNNFRRCYFSPAAPFSSSNVGRGKRAGAAAVAAAEEQRRRRRSFASSTSSSTSSTPPSFSVDASAAALALRSKPTRDLLRSYLVLSACRIGPLVRHGELLLKVSRAFPPLRKFIVDPLIKNTFFAQFCGGETEAELGPCVARLRRQGVGAILDYAAEPDESSSSSSSSSSSNATSSSPSSTSTDAEAAVAAAAAPPSLAVARTHEYGDEGLCDSNAGHVMRAIEAAAAASEAGAEAGEGEGGTEAEASGAAFAAAAVAASPSSSPPSPPSSSSTSTSTCTFNPLPAGYAAVKLTALTDPRVLVKLSACLREIEELFERFDADADGKVSRKEFESAYRETFTDGDEPGRLDELWGYLSRSRNEGEGEKEEQQQRDFVDLQTWTSRIKLRDVPLIVPRCRTLGPLAAASPTPEELWRLENLMERLRALAAAAKEKNVRLLVDAEYTAVQPAIDAAALELMREFNGGESSGSDSSDSKKKKKNGNGDGDGNGNGDGDRSSSSRKKKTPPPPPQPIIPVPPTVYNTTQCYLLGAEAKLRGEIELSRKEGFAWGGKLVRGAYIDSEKKRAALQNRPSPCWPSLEETHTCYDRCARVAVEEGVFYSGGGGRGKGEVLLATHNKASVSKAVDLLSRLERERPGDAAASSRVSFGQLYGMSESLTLATARAGRRAYVYLPYGPLGEVLPYLLRRALENSQMLSGGGGGGEEVEKGSRSENGSGKAAKQPLSELDAVRKELKARAVGVFLPRDK